MSSNFQPGTIVDAFGVPYPAPGTPPPPYDYTPAGVERDANDRYRQHLTRGLTPRKLAGILDRGEQGDPRDLFELCEEMIEKDLKLGSVLETRTNAVLGLNWNVMPAELDDATDAEMVLADEIARHCERGLRAANFDELKGDLLDAVAKPFAVDWIYWGFDRDGKTVPRKFCRIPGTHMRWEFKKDILRVYDPMNPVTFQDGELGQPVPQYSTVRALWNTRRDNPLRSGLCRAVAFYYHFKVTAWKDCMAYMDRYGMGIRVAKIPPTQFNDPAFVDKIKSALRTLGSEGSGVFTSDTEMEIVAAAETGGVEVFTNIMDAVDKGIAQRVLGHELSSQSAPGPGQLGITASMDVKQEVLEADCNRLSEIIKEQLLTPMTEWNWGVQIAERGLVPTIWFDYEPARDLTVDVGIYKIAAETFGEDFEFSENQFRDEFGFDRPEDDDDVMVAKAKPVPQPFGQQPGVPGQPNVPGQEQPEPPDKGEEPTVNRVLALARKRRKRRRAPTRYARARQHRIDRLGDRDIEIGKREQEKIQQQLVGILRAVLAEGGTYADARSAIIRSYPDVSVKKIEELMKTGLELARTAGRNGG